MAETILVPDIGDYKDVAVIDVAVKVGDTISEEAELITLETDKATMEIPSPKAGTIAKLLVEVGSKVSEGSPILELNVSGEATDANLRPSDDTSGQTRNDVVKTAELDATAAASTQARNDVGSAAKLADDAPAYAGPGTRRFARELNVNLNNCQGTGRKSRIVESDVKNYVSNVMQDLVSGNLGGISTTAPKSGICGPFEEIELSRIKKISGKFLHNNWVSIPHVTQFDEADITELEAFRQGQKALAEKQGLKLTPLVFLLKAVVAALKQFPQFNAELSADGSKLLQKQYYHIGVAVDTPNGLVVPVVRDVDQKGLFELAENLGTLSKSARDGKLSGKDMQGGGFSISSLGGIGGSAFTPIINAPELAILGVSKSRQTPVYRDGELVSRLMLPLSLSYDHRVIDGAEAARFTSFISAQLADIRRLLL